MKFKKPLASLIYGICSKKQNLSTVDYIYIMYVYKQERECVSRLTKKNK